MRGATGSWRAALEEVVLRRFSAHAVMNYKGVRDIFVSILVKIAGRDTYAVWADAA